MFIERNRSFLSRVHIFAANDIEILIMLRATSVPSLINLSNANIINAIKKRPKRDVRAQLEMDFT